MLVKVYRQESERETLKSAMYVTHVGDLDFLQHSLTLSNTHYLKLLQSW